jgi:phage FluMu protein Com
MRCGFCGKTLKSLAGLSIHMAKMHPEKWVSDAEQIEAEHEMIVEKHNRWKQARGGDKK